MIKGLPEYAWVDGRASAPTVVSDPYVLANHQDQSGVNPWSFDFCGRDPIAAKTGPGV
tara:strand:+ start:926 stop:1099 length:174 start_codon:yes stop_codon:yes gene_type:complete